MMLFITHQIVMTDIPLTKGGLISNKHNFICSKFCVTGDPSVMKTQRHREDCFYLSLVKKGPWCGNVGGQGCALMVAGQVGHPGRAGSPVSLWSPFHLGTAQDQSGRGSSQEREEGRWALAQSMSCCEVSRACLDGEEFKFLRLGSEKERWQEKGGRRRSERLCF